MQSSDDEIQRCEQAIEVCRHHVMSGESSTWVDRDSRKQLVADFEGALAGWADNSLELALIRAEFAAMRKQAGREAVGA